LLRPPPTFVTIEPVLEPTIPARLACGRWAGARRSRKDNPLQDNDMDEPRTIRSPELMSRDDTILLVIDVQEKLVPHVRQHSQLIWNIRRLLDGAGILGLPVAATEQYPRGLGKTMAPLAERLGEVPDKLTFSCAGCGQLFARFAQQQRPKVLVVGVETHVCVQQTVLDLISDGFRAYVAVDAVSSRYELDYQTALRRMEISGAVLTTTEAALFEWCEIAGTPEFKQISALARETPPEGHSP
jgi:nicotinamidase-related amidase